MVDGQQRLRDVHSRAEVPIVGRVGDYVVSGQVDRLSETANAVHIIDGRVKHSVLLELLTDTGVGTLIKG